jgi:hypothetical protein
MLKWVFLLLITASLLEANFSCDQGSVETECIINSRKGSFEDVKMMVNNLIIKTTGYIIVDNTYEVIARGSIVLEGKSYISAKTIKITSQRLRIESETAVSTDGMCKNCIQGTINNWIGASHVGGGSVACEVDRKFQEAKVYGDAFNPQSTGSYGVYGSSCGGGGLIEIASTQIDLDGNINSNGMGFYGQGGSAGSVNIKTSQINGKGTIQANGGANARGSGSGGRILLEANVISPEIMKQITAYGGSDPKFCVNEYESAAGTIYLPIQKKLIISSRKSQKPSEPTIIPVINRDIDVLVLNGASLQCNECKMKSIELISANLINLYSKSSNYEVDEFAVDAESKIKIEVFKLTSKNIKIDGNVQGKDISISTDTFTLKGKISSTNTLEESNEGIGSNGVFECKSGGGAGHGGKVN